MIILSQRKPVWTNVKLGQSNQIIGKVGCTTTCISMLSDYFGCFQNPITLAQHLLMYTPDGLLGWESVNKIPCMKFEKRLRMRDDVEIQVSLKDPNKAVILEVDSSHWVVATGRIPLTSTYTIIDPWFGDRALSTRYGRITGSAHFFRK